jgi:hypothetical protein
MMEQNEAGAEYFNILADITLGRNFQDHYQTVTSRIAALNRSIDRKKEANEDCSWIVSVCYHYYRLQELIRCELKHKSTGC